MATRSDGYFLGCRAVAPAEILEDELDFRGIPLEDFCIDARLDLDFLKELIRGEHPITPELAQKFESLIGIDAQIWLTMQEDYEYDKRVLAERKNAKQAKHFEQMQPEMA